MRRVGTTIDGRPVVAGLFALHETHGLPLDVVIAECLAAGSEPSWAHMLGDAIGVGMRLDRAVSKLQAAAADAGHPERAAVHAGLELLRNDFDAEPAQAGTLNGMVPTASNTEVRNISNVPRQAGARRTAAAARSRGFLRTGDRR